MNGIHRLSGIALIAIGIVVAVHTIIEPLYHVSSEDYPYSPLWTQINWLTALSIVLGVTYSAIRTRDAGGDGPVSREYLAANLQFYGFLFVGILFLWNWFQLFSPGYTATAAAVRSLVWVFIDAAQPLLAVTLGLHLVRGAGRSGQAGG